jgi:mRNA-degrading endonuclease toxin of MazEF toxin-antitoxin module
MEKDFDTWNSQKKILHKKDEKVFYHEREIWWCSLGVNVGYEQDGTGKRFDRPVVVVRGFSPHACIIVPLTGKKKEGKYYMYLGKIEGRDATAVLSQIKNIDPRRLLKKMGMLPDDEFEKLKDKLKNLLFR